MELVDDGYKGRPLLLHVGMSLFRVLTGFFTGAAGRHAAGARHGLLAAS